MHRYPKIVSLAAVIAFLTAVLLCCCWQDVTLANMILPEQASCHSDVPTHQNKTDEICQCPHLVSATVEKSATIASGAYDYLKWALESLDNPISFSSFPTIKPTMGGPPSRYASATALYLRNSILRI